MKVALDEGVPEQIGLAFREHEVRSVGQLGLKGVTNGRLLDAIECAEFGAFITNDKRMERERNLSRRPFATLLLSTNNWPSMAPHVKAIAAAVDQAGPGVVTIVECGNFVPRRFRKPSGFLA